MIRTGTRLYRTYYSMKRRCYNKNSQDYKHYGGRGIRMCDEWLSDFMTFHDWARANGYTDDLTIDRIDSNGNYEPNNCRWATMKEQQNNRRNNVLITLGGVTKTDAQWREFREVNPKAYWKILNANLRDFVLGTSKTEKKHCK